jgi:pimeloyl-ACP methyl ester carboxylesterase
LTGRSRLTPLGRRPPVAGGIDLDLPGSGVRLAATRWPGSGQPVVLLHGLASQRRFWDLVVPDLVGLPVLAVDQRGHGDSDQPDDGYDFVETVGDIGTALDALGWSRAVVVGHSWGASVALSFAAAHPERTLAVVAIDGGVTSFAERDEPREELRARLEPPRFAMPPDDLRAMLRQGQLAAWWTADVEAALLPIFGVGDDGLARARLPFELHMKVVDALLDYDPGAVLAGVRCPAWLVSCEPAMLEEADDWQAAWAREKASGLARAAELLAHPRLFRWGGALHDVPLQWPALVAGLIRSAVRDAAGGTPQ